MRASFVASRCASMASSEAAVVSVMPGVYRRELASAGTRGPWTIGVDGAAGLAASIGPMTDRGMKPPPFAGAHAGRAGVHLPAISARTRRLAPIVLTAVILAFAALEAAVV